MMDLLWAIGFTLVGVYGCLVGMALGHEATAITGWWVAGFGLADIWVSEELRDEP